MGGMMRGKPGLYGGCDQPQGGFTLEARIDENALVEGEHVAKLHEFWKRQDWIGMEKYLQTLDRDGFSKARIDSMIVRATHGAV